MSDVRHHDSGDSDRLEHRSTTELPPRRASPWPWIVLTIVLSQSLDNGMSRVYDRQRGLLTTGDPNLETQVRQEADQQILQAACQDGILRQANTNAQTPVRALLVTMGFRQVEFLPANAVADTGCPEY